MNSSPSPPLPELLVIDRLEVGPVKLERKRLIAPYTVYRNGEANSTELIYSYEAPVFEPGEAGSQNLADMVAAQVALNYGLFCRQIVFHGKYDAADQRFLRNMAENTAREIYVMKLLQPNPFLTGAIAQLEPQTQKHYLNAELVFPENFSGKNLPLWETDSNRHAILSSGGKDSLLSYGLLNELGREVHSIFGNESGRHWFTALNAYRHFRDHVPFTGRVWMNSDRVFAWMLRQLPFIRPDFASLRSDEYPIRLWTVAVFIFGVLPLLRQRGIARVIIGDEYDTTWRAALGDIPHYNGLYDQSIYFDSALTRYYQQKGWGLTQFSLLRQLSELLIMTILVKRYPDLQAHQVSCHASHKEGERVYPCGKCEKCRRIVGMLSALDADPTRCGYTPTQIAHCLKALEDKGVHQESAGASHLRWMLAEKGHLALPEKMRKSLKPHPEIVNLRFHPDRSPAETVPEDLRRPLFRIFLEHAEGALARREGKWVKFDPLA